MFAHSEFVNALGDDTENKFHSEYIESYLHHAIPGETIEEWTSREGVHFHASSEIYRPLAMAVSIQGSSPNQFSVDTTRSDWQERFTGAVKQVLVGAGIARAQDTVVLSTVRGKPISGYSIEQMEKVGVVYPMVNGRRCTEAIIPAAVAAPRGAGAKNISSNISGGAAANVSPVAAIGEQLKTPPTHAINADELLAGWAARLCESAIDGLVREASKATALSELDKCLFDDSRVKPTLQKLIQSSVSHLNSFEELISVHGDEAMAADLKARQLDLNEISSEIADQIMSQVELAYRAHQKDVVDFFHNEDAKASRIAAAAIGNKLNSSPGAGATGKRTVFGGVVVPVLAGEPLIDYMYPSAAKLHKTLISAALIRNHNLECGIQQTIKGGAPGYRRKRHGRRRRNNKEKEIPAAAPAPSADEKGGDENATTTPAPMKAKIGAPAVANYRDLFSHAPESYVAALELLHVRARLPRAPGLDMFEKVGAAPTPYVIMENHRNFNNSQTRHRRTPSAELAHYRANMTAKEREAEKRGHQRVLPDARKAVKLMNESISANAGAPPPLEYRNTSSSSVGAVIGSASSSPVSRGPPPPLVLASPSRAAAPAPAAPVTQTRSSPPPPLRASAPVASPAKRAVPGLAPVATPMPSLQRQPQQKQQPDGVVLIQNRIPSASISSSTAEVSLPPVPGVVSLPTVARK